MIVGGAEAWRLADRIAREKVPVILEPPHSLPSTIDPLDTRLDAPAILRKAGATVALALGDRHGFYNLRQEAGIAVAHGLP